MATKKQIKKVTKKIENKKNNLSQVPTALTSPENLYQLTIQLNDQTFDFETDNLAESILSCAPEFLKTKLVLKFSRGGKSVERVFSLFDGRRLFHNKYFLENLINNLSI